MSSNKKRKKENRRKNREERRHKKLAKRKAERKDWKKKKNIMTQELEEMKKGKRKLFSVQIPRRTKYE